MLAIASVLDAAFAAADLLALTIGDAVLEILGTDDSFVL